MGKLFSGLDQVVMALLNREEGKEKEVAGEARHDHANEQARSPLSTGGGTLKRAARLWKRALQPSQWRKYLKIPPEERSEVDVQSLMELSKELNFFQQIAVIHRRAIVKHTTYASLGKNEILFKQNDRGDHFYIIISGEVEVRSVTVSGVSTLSLPKINSISSEQEAERFGPVVQVLHPGDGLGQVALTSSEGLRSATVIARTDTEFIALSRTAYEENIKQLDGIVFYPATCQRALVKNPINRTQQDIEMLEDFLLKKLAAKNKFLAKMSPTMSRELCRSMSLLSAEPEEVLCEQGQPGDVFYIIISGSVSVHKTGPALGAEKEKGTLEKKLRAVTMAAKLSRKLLKRRASVLSVRGDSATETNAEATELPPITEKKDEEQSEKQNDTRPTIETGMFALASATETPQIEHASRDKSEQTLPSITPTSGKYDVRRQSTELSRIHKVTGRIESLYGPCISTLVSGMSFGEIALTHNTVRNATIITREHTEFIVVSQKDYQRILQRVQEQQIEEMTNALKQVAIFKEWSDQDLLSLSFHMKEKTFEAGHLIYNEPTDTADCIHFIKSGECNVHLPVEEVVPVKPVDRIFDALENGAAEAEAEMREADERERISKSKKVVRSAIRMEGDELVYPQRHWQQRLHGLDRGILHGPSTQAKSKMMTVSILSVGEFFGEKVVMENSKPHMALVTAKTEVSLLSISKKDFLNRVDRESVVQLQQASEERWRFRQERIKKAFHTVKQFSNTQRNALVTIAFDTEKTAVVKNRGSAVMQNDDSMLIPNKVQKKAHYSDERRKVFFETQGGPSIDTDVLRALRHPLDVGLRAELEKVAFEQVLSSQSRIKRRLSGRTKSSPRNCTGIADLDNVHSPLMQSTRSGTVLPSSLLPLQTPPRPPQTAPSLGRKPSPRVTKGNCKRSLWPGSDDEGILESKGEDRAERKAELQKSTPLHLDALLSPRFPFRPPRSEEHTERVLTAIATPRTHSVLPSSSARENFGTTPLLPPRSANRKTPVYSKPYDTWGKVKAIEGKVKRFRKASSLSKSKIDNLTRDYLMKVASKVPALVGPGPSTKIQNSNFL